MVVMQDDDNPLVIRMVSSMTMTQFTQAGIVKKSLGSSLLFGW